MTLKLGVIGTGAIGQEHICRCNNVLQGAKVVAVSDINVEGARAALQRLNIEAEVYQDGHQVINSPEVDCCAGYLLGFDSRRIYASGHCRRQTGILRKAAGAECGGLSPCR